MANVVSGKKCVHSFRRNEASELGHISQIRKILKKLVKKKEIVSFSRISERLDNSLAYRIFYLGERYFDFVLCAPILIKPFGGVEIIERRGWKLVISLDKFCRPKKIQNILVKDIKTRKKGLKAEEVFHMDMLTLITRDREVSRVISSVKKSKPREDSQEKIDFFFTLANGKEIPIQIKSDISNQKKHERNCSNVPSLVYKNTFLKNNRLKNKVLQICRNYPNIIEHL